MISAALVAACAAAAAIPGADEALQYDRARVGSGELWRLLTGQMVHWTPRMALADLGTTLLLGACLEAAGLRAVAAAAIVLGAALTAAGIHLAPSGPDFYRGSSGIAAALFVLLSLEVLRRRFPAWTGLFALLSLALLAAKAAWEYASGGALAAGSLPSGVSVMAEVHLLGGGGGALACVGARLLTRPDGAPPRSGRGRTRQGP